MGGRGFRSLEGREGKRHGSKAEALFNVRGKMLMNENTVAELGIRKIFP